MSTSLHASFDARGSGPAWGRAAVLGLLATTLLACSSYGQSHSSVSLPIACFQVKISPHSQMLVSLAFEPHTPSVTGVLGTQLSAGSVLKWDASNSIYQTAYHGPDGRWFSDVTLLTPSDMTLVAGDGFWLRNNTETTQMVCLTGMIVRHETPVFTYPPALSLRDTPYAAYPSFTNPAVGQIWRPEPSIVAEVPQAAPVTTEEPVLATR